MKTACLLPLIAGLLASLLGGCASPTEISSMALGSIGVEKQHGKSVSVSTGGGEETNPAWLSKVSDQDLASAIEASIRNTKLFSGVVKLGDADYRLHAAIVNLSQPVMGFNLTVKTEILWTLTPKAGEKPVWQQTIRSASTKGAGDAFSFAARVRITTEAAIKANINTAFSELSQLRLE
jgi:hypothetical protein